MVLDRTVCEQVRPDRRAEFLYPRAYTIAGGANEIMRNMIAERGLNAGSPAYFVDDEFFWGGQHLDMIRWILAGREGRGPI